MGSARTCEALTRIRQSARWQAKGGLAYAPTVLMRGAAWCGDSGRKIRVQTDTNLGQNDRRVKRPWECFRSRAYSRSAETVDNGCPGNGC